MPSTTLAASVAFLICFLRVCSLGVVFIIAGLVGRTGALGMCAGLKPELCSSRDLVILDFVLSNLYLDALLL